MLDGESFEKEMFGLLISKMITLKFIMFLYEQ